MAPISTTATTTVTQSRGKALGKYTREEVAKHDTADDLWIIVDGKVYDVTKYFSFHPGGTVIATMAGKDASDAFRTWHSDLIRSTKLPTFLVGELTDPLNDGLSAEYRKDKAELIQAVVDAGFYTTNWNEYIWPFVMPVVYMLTGITMALMCESFVMHSIVASLVLALGWHQAAWVGHDMMHSSIFESPTVNHMVGAVYGNFMTGISVGWWKYTHNMHHAVVNQWDIDPDITHMPLFAVTARMFLDPKRRDLSPAEERMLRLLLPIQHIFYFPVMLFARFNLYLQGILMFALGNVQQLPFQRVHLPKTLVRMEVAGLAGFWLWFVSLVYFGLYKPYGFEHAAWFVGVGHLYMGMLHIQITLSHWERPMTASAENNSSEWMRAQAQTGRNVEPGFMNFHDWYFGGLNYQIEHHMFPRVRRNNLPRLKKLVQPFCLKHNIPYCSTNMRDAVKDVIASLADVAGQVKHYEEYRRQRQVLLSRAPRRVPYGIGE